MIKNKIAYIIITIVVVLALGTFLRKNYDFSSKISSYFNKNCKSDIDCTLVLADITNFNWDKVFFFPEGVVLDSKEFIDMFGKLDHGLNDGQVVFTLNNKVVHYEILKNGIETKIKNQILISDPSAIDNRYYSYPYEDATFVLKRQKISGNGYFGGGYYFILSNFKMSMPTSTIR